jgi:hypothetical protein
MTKFDKYGVPVRVSVQHKKIIEANAKEKRQTIKAWVETAVEKANKIKAIALFSIILVCCKKETKVIVWECDLQNGIKTTIVSDTMPVIKTINQFNNLVICNCEKLK